MKEKLSYLNFYISRNRLFIKYYYNSTRFCLKPNKLKSKLFLLLKKNNIIQLVI